MPRIVGVENADQLIQVCDLIRNSSEPIELDCSSVRFFDPLGLTVLASTLETVQTVQPGRSIDMPWLSKGSTSYLERMDFFSRVNVGKVDLPLGRVRNDLRGRLLELRRLQGPEGSETIAEQLASSIASMIIGRPPWPFSFHAPDTEHERYCSPLRYALSELIENALTHAKRNGRSEANVWVASQYYTQPEHVHIAVVDDGCGFLSTLKDHPEMLEQSHRGAILTALKPKVSCNRNLGMYLESVNEGIGLTTTVRMSKATGGSVHIISGNAMVFENSMPLKRNERAVPLQANWSGVAVSATFLPRLLRDTKTSDHLPLEEPKTKGISAPVDLRFDD